MSASEAERLRKRMLELAVQCTDPKTSEALVDCAIEAALLHAAWVRLEQSSEVKAVRA